VPLAGLIDPVAEVKRLEKQKAEKLKALQAAQAKLGNASFVERASPEVVQQQRDLVKELQAQLRVIDENLKEFAST
jgi:valyl-tRNA synthetase